MPRPAPVLAGLVLALGLGAAARDGMDRWIDRTDLPLTLAEIARRTGTSPRSLQAQFRSRLGATAQAHYLALRLAEAQRLVTDTAMSLTDIGLATGFASQSSFSRAFRAAYGRSAREVRSGR